MLTRRTVLSAGAAALTLTCPVARAARSYTGPNVILVRFGGGVRRRETIEAPHTFCPWLLREFAPRGTLFTNMLLDDAKHVETSHGQGTLYLLTGRYDHLVNQSGQLLGERFEPPAPTLFEYFRRAFDVPSHETLIINGEDRTSEEFYTFSNHHQYGVAYRSEVLSLFRFKTWLTRMQLAEDQFPTDEAREQATQQLARRLRVDARRSEADGQGPVLNRFWEDWRARYGDNGLKNARGDRLITELARTAMQRFQPRMLMLNYQDPDYVHWGHGAHYTRAISIIDRSLRELVAFTEAHPFYRNNTVFVVVPDCGRDDNPLQSLPYQHHFKSRSAHEIFALLVGPGIAAGRVVNREVQQLDVAATIAGYAGFPAPEISGSPLTEAFA